jgi:succinate dehydrogenase / fumarate reductase flavoprotein subunit
MVMDRSANVLSTDVLIIGGGISGLYAANKAADEGASVLIVEKSTTGWGGQMPLSGGFFAYVPPDKAEDLIRYYVAEGEYLNDQEMTEAVVKSLLPCAEEVTGWGMNSLAKGFDGKLLVTAGTIGFPQRDTVMPMMLDRALQRNARVLNKVYMVDLLKNDGRVVGAAGFHYQTGEFYTVKAKTTILACGGCMYKTRGLWHTNCGEGPAMAYNAGAEMRNAEFANMFNVANKYTMDDAGGSIGAARTLGVNARGESMMQKYPEINAPEGIRRGGGMLASGSSWRIVRAWAKEIEAGGGPIYLDLTLEEARARMPMLFDLSGRSRGSLHMGYASRMRRVGVDITKEKVEWVIVPEFHEGPVRIDANGQTTVPGVYATGDLAWHGSAFVGAMDWHIGVPQGFCMVTGFWAGSHAGKTALSLPEEKLYSSQVEDLRKQVYAPLDAKGGYSPYDAIREIQQVVFKLKNSFLKSRDRLEKALGAIENIESKFPDLTARDSHELVRCHEAKNMATCAEILYRASLARTETRGSNVREDCPERDDENWLSWVIVKKEGGETKVRTEPIPIERYKYKPTSI